MNIESLGTFIAYIGDD